ncbi:conserved hypothetical protein [Xenorhabdus bovienii str. oregonense]|uniref:DUF5405 domain-containing protein n=1 Tax=Xenorhabdus bovienii str. oregonense TaxID=1398202 RepID=A0A077P053_XENBV|nr:DUF5405 family protein [Xenorhabdus bovienii]CDH04405.1 conserved hypothetical protein [Xenorhabdus bovienii str. oregonense]
MSLRIDLGKYVITSNSRSFILNTKTILKSGENIGQENLSPLGYYPHLHQMHRDLIRLKINDDDIADIKQLGEKIDSIAKELAEKSNITHD